MLKLSRSEKQYIIDGVEEGLRLDGRARLDYRDFSLETGIVAQTNGSARVKLANHTDVLVGVKVEIGEVDPDFPDQGRLEVHVECSPSASHEFEGRGAEEMNAQLISTLRDLLKNSFAMDWSKLCIVKGKQCWILYVDCIVLDSAGNLYDALAIATRSALYNTKIPKIEVIEISPTETEFEVSDDPNDYERIDCSNIPISVTLGKIGSKYIVDPSIEEEECISTRLTVSVNRKGNICSIKKSGKQSGINPSELTKMFQSARKIGTTLLEQLDTLLETEEKTTIKQGFFTD
ncbi:hypothetical protein ABK040_001450 [Willaertia magna]